MKFVFIVFFVLWLCYAFIPFIVDIICMKKCGYDCSKCKSWQCNYHHCKRKREKLESKSKEQ